MGTANLWRAAAWLAAVLPRGLAYRVADAVGCMCFLLRPVARAAVEENVRVVLGLPRYSGRVRRVACEVFQNFGRAVVDFLMLGSPARDWKNEVSVEGASILMRERAQGRPVVLVGAHLGPWEIGAASLVGMGVPLAVVTRPHRNRGTEEFFTDLRRRAGLRVVRVPWATRKVVRILRENGCVAMLTDRGFGDGRAVRFFGRRARVPWGAVACALRTGASLIPGYTLRQGGCWRVILRDPVRLQRTGDWRRDVRAGMAQCMSVLERFIRSHPEQWFVFEPVWGNQCVV